MLTSNNKSALDSFKIELRFSTTVNAMMTAQNIE